MPKIAVVGEAYGENEEKLGIPLVGASGIELLNMMSEAGLIRLTVHDLQCIEDFWRKGRDPTNIALVWAAHKEEFFTTNVFNLRPNSANDISVLFGTKAETASILPPLRAGKYCRPEHLHHLSRLAEELRSCKPNLVIALGNTPAWALIHNTSIGKIRGTVFPCKLVEGLKVLPTYHPASIFRQYENRAVTVLDLAKAKREAEFPDIVRPRRTIHVPESVKDIESYISENFLLAERIACDIETSGTQITCIGFSARPTEALVIPFIDTRRAGNSYWKSLEEELQVWELVRQILSLPAEKVFQNGLYDLHFIYRGYGIRPVNCEHDTMLLHHALHPESPKGLGFLGSVYTSEPAWKLMRTRHTNKRDE